MLETPSCAVVVHSTTNQQKDYHAVSLDTHELSHTGGAIPGVYIDDYLVDLEYWMTIVCTWPCASNVHKTPSLILVDRSLAASNVASISVHLSSDECPLCSWACTSPPTQHSPQFCNYGILTRGLAIQLDEINSREENSTKSTLF